MIRVTDATNETLKVYNRTYNPRNIGKTAREWDATVEKFDVIHATLRDNLGRIFFVEPTNKRAEHIRTKSVEG